MLGASEDLFRSYSKYHDELDRLESQFYEQGGSVIVDFRSVLSVADKVAQLAVKGAKDQLPSVPEWNENLLDNENHQRQASSKKLLVMLLQLLLTLGWRKLLLKLVLKLKQELKRWASRRIARLAY